MKIHNLLIQNITTIKKIIHDLYTLKYPVKDRVKVQSHLHKYIRNTIHQRFLMFFTLTIFTKI